MTGTFIDTLIVCTMTGLAIIITGTWNIGEEGVGVTITSFSQCLPGFLAEAGPVILLVCLIFFAFTTMLGWNFYGERCLEYLVGRNKKAILTYRVLYILAVFIGPYMTIQAVWDIADIFNGLMAIPNLIAVILLSGEVVRLSKSFFKRFPKLTSEAPPPPEEEEKEERYNCEILS